MNVKRGRLNVTVNGFRTDQSSVLSSDHEDLLDVVKHRRLNVEVIGLPCGWGSGVGSGSVLSVHTACPRVRECSGRGSPGLGVHLSPEPHGAV